jgi:hypothetical protein
MGTIVLTDADPIVYRVGFAGQQKVIHAVVEGPEGVPVRQRFENKTDRKNWLEENQGWEILDEQEELVVEPLPFVLQTCKQIYGVLETLGTPKSYLTGKKNFRNGIAKTAVYKGNRKPDARPVHYEAIREYLQTKWGAIVINGREADDELSIQAARMRKAGQKYVIATIDKDLDQIPGEHYDYSRHVSYHVSEEDAAKWFWQQVLSGDRVDNIPGCYKVGPETARKLVDEWYLEPQYQPAEIWEAVLEQYVRSQSKSGCPYKDQCSDEVALETAQLVWMQTEAGALWMPPGVPYGRVEGDEDDA